MKRARAALVACVCLAFARDVHAHAFAPSLLALREGANGAVEVMWKTPHLRVRGSDVRPVLPAVCRERTPPVVEQQEIAMTVRWQVDCGDAGLLGARVAIDGLAMANTNGLIRVMLADGRTVQQVVTSAAPSLIIPAPPRRTDVLRDYLVAGAMHILGRADRVLFLLGLLLLAPAALSMAQTLAAFTLGHSVTLPAAVLGIVSIPSRTIEIVLAVTILTLATELAREPGRTWMRRFPWAMGFAFGLLHGLGFAAVLIQIGLPATDVAPALFAFNVGIEIGQLFFVCIALTAMRYARSLAARLPAWVQQVPVYVMGSLAAFWCFERAAAALR